jgi:hypothetical protein
MADSSIDFVVQELAARLELGASLDAVQDQVIDAAPALSEDERAALWLFAWSYRPQATARPRDLLKARG